MSHRFTNIPNSVVLTSEIDDIVVSTNNDFVDFVIMHADGTVILSERFYAYNNCVTISNVASLMELELRKRNSSFGTFRLQAFSQSQEVDFIESDLSVVYCDRTFIGTESESFFKNCFLSPATIKRIAEDSIIDISLFAKESESLKYSVVACYRDLSTNIESAMDLYFNTDDYADADGVYNIQFSTDKLIAAVAKESRVQICNIELAYFSVYCGNRTISFFLDDTLSEDNNFSFKNCFNVNDSIYVPGVTTTKSKIDRSLALINGKVRFYDQSATDLYEVQSAGLSSNEAETISQLFSSRDVWRMVKNLGDDTEPWIDVPILITDSTCEIADSDESLVSVKFSWRFSHERQYFMPKSSDGVFGSNFNPAFN